MSDKEKKILEKTGDFEELLIESLRDPKKAAAYLQVALDEYQEDRDTEIFLLALKNVTKAQGGISKLAEKTKLNRQHLYHALSPKGNPSLNTLGDIIHALGFHLSIDCAAAA